MPKRANIYQDHSKSIASGSPALGSQELYCPKEGVVDPVADEWERQVLCLNLVCSAGSCLMVFGSKLDEVLGTLYFPSTPWLVHHFMPKHRSVQSSLDISNGHRWCQMSNDSLEPKLDLVVAREMEVTRGYATLLAHRLCLATKVFPRFGGSFKSLECMSIFSSLHL